MKRINLIRVLKIVVQIITIFNRTNMCTKNYDAQGRARQEQKLSRIHAKIRSIIFSVR